MNDRDVTVPQNQADGPMYVDVTSLLHPGENTVSLSGGDSSLASAQLVSRYYLPWDGQVPDSRDVTSTGKPDGLRLHVEFDRTEASAGSDVRCTVEAERIGSRGYGMMIAEIGLPPGADVDRRSLDQMLSSSGWSISRYDVLPDRLLVYVWPRAGGIKFGFTFRPRFGLDAMRTFGALRLLQPRSERDRKTGSFCDPLMTEIAITCDRGVNRGFALLPVCRRSSRLPLARAREASVFSAP